MVRYLLDTDICSYVIRGGHGKLDARVARARPESLFISVVTRAELLYGVEHRGRPPALAALVGSFLEQVDSMAWDDDAARHYAEIRAGLERNGKPVGNLDIMIAAHARSQQAVLVTNNDRHFRNVPDLKRENWVRA